MKPDADQIYRHLDLHFAEIAAEYWHVYVSLSAQLPVSPNAVLSILSPDDS